MASQDDKATAAAATAGAGSAATPTGAAAEAPSGQGTVPLVKSQLVSAKQSLINIFNHIGFIQDLSTKTSQPPHVVGFSLLGATCALTYLIFGGLFFSNLLGLGLPAYNSFKALQTRDKSDDTRWLTYWVVFCFVTMVEGFVRSVLFWMPFYVAVKLAVLYWLYNIQGSEWTFTNLVMPAMRYLKLDNESLERAKAAAESNKKKLS